MLCFTINSIDNLNPTPRWKKAFKKTKNPNNNKIMEVTGARPQRLRQLQLMALQWQKRPRLQPLLRQALHIRNGSEFRVRVYGLGFLGFRVYRVQDLGYKVLVLPSWV